jgi:hypothetical protein
MFYSLVCLIVLSIATGLSYGKSINVTFASLLTYDRKVFGQNICSLWPARKYYGRVKSYELEPEFCALFEYGLRNFVPVFVWE